MTATLQTDVRMDVIGYYTKTATGGGFVALRETKLFDTRDAGQGGVIPAGGSITRTLTGGIAPAGGPYPRILDTGCDYAAVGTVAARRAS